jgi:hypothetical protein
MKLYPPPPFFCPAGRVGMVLPPHTGRRRRAAAEPGEVPIANFIFATGIENGIPLPYA